MKVRCIRLLDSSGEPTERSSWAKLGETYHVLSIEIGPGRVRLRLVGDEPTPALFEPEMFEVVASTIPRNWVITSLKVGHLEIGPRAWARPGFWVEYFDGAPDAIACFEQERKQIVATEP